MAAACKVLVVHENPSDFDRYLQQRFPDVAFLFAAAPDAVAPALAQEPQAAFSISFPGFPKTLCRMIAAAPSLRWLHVGGSGYEQYLPFDNLKLTVTNSAGILARFLAETVLGALLMLNGHFLEYRDHQRAARWSPISFEPLFGKTLLVVGAGAIGGHLCRFAKALGMRVIAIRASGASLEGADEVHKPEALLDLLPRADAVSLHVRLTEETRHMIDAEALAAMRPTAFLLNTARGPVVEEAALVAALEAGRIAGAYLDVFDQEPLPVDSPLWALDRLFVTPHAADNVSNWSRRFAVFFADNLERWLKGEPLVNLVKAAQEN